MNLYGYCSIIYDCQDMEAAQVSIDRWMDKEDVVNIDTKEYYSAIRKDEYLSFTSTWLELEGIMLNEISQAEKDNYYIVRVHSYVEQKE